MSIITKIGINIMFLYQEKFNNLPNQYDTT